MNEQIKELAKQAGLEMCGCGCDMPTRQSAKFAELIVKECLNQCAKVREDAISQKRSEFLTESGKTLYDGVYGGATNCGFAIQQHFGVE